MESIDYNSKNNLVKAIAGLQSPGNRYYAKGMFRVQRLLPFFLYYREDDNIYFPVLINFILQDIKENLSEEGLGICNKIISGIEENYSKYQNRENEATYGFYRTQPGGHYPHGWLLSKFDSLKLPDDADDTALIYLTKQHTKEEILWIKEKLAFHANLQRGRIVKKTVPQYENLKAYSTWFGSDKVYVDFDIGVMSNIMRFVFENDLSLNEHDYDTMKFIESVILNDEYIDHTFIVGPWYPDINIILYHVSRMMAPFDKPEYEQLKYKVISDLKKHLTNAKSFMEYIILSTSLMRFKEPAVENPFPPPTNKELKNFSWGVTPILYTLDFIYNMKNPTIKKLVASKPLNYQFRCIAHCLALILENVVYRERLPVA
ncbi:MAG: hypothetical protein KAR38_16345 [Calditrichia bacterium]|nr:hypothetical protein [Calditrichia bacterium]